MNKKIKLENKVWKLRYLSKDKIERNWEEFQGYFEENLINKIKIDYGEDSVFVLKLLFKNNIFNTASFLGFIKSPYSERNKKWDSNQRRFKLPPEDVNLGKGHLKGKKRPDHAAKMKKVMKTLKRSEEHKKNLEEFHKKRFKRKRLLNLGLISSEDSKKLSEEEIKKIYGEFVSKQNKSIPHKKRKIKKFLLNEKYENNDIYLSFREEYRNSNLDEIDVESVYREMVSIISTISYQNPDNNMGSTKFFMREWKSNLNNEINGLTRVKVKSSYESKTIDFFEKENIKWSYEPFTIKTSDFRHYTPDFLFLLGANKYILEVKGFIRNDDHQERIFKNLDSLHKLKSPEFEILYLRDVFDSIEKLEKAKYSPKEK